MTQRLPRPALVFWLFIWTLIHIMTFFVTTKVFHLAQILIVLLIIFFDYSSIDFSGQNVRGLAQFLILIQIKALFGGLVRGLAWLARLTTTTTIIIIKSIGGFFNLGVFLVFKVSLYQSMAMKTMNIAFLSHRNGLRGYFSFDINGFFNDLLPVIKILIFFIKVRPYQWLEAILEITDEEFICKHCLGIKFF